ncbi:MAG: insulinase family protein [Holosporales bacterium]|jgi:zinc protease|nr:insulinase family protein [Holosporales bacterium]
MNRKLLIILTIVVVLLSYFCFQKISGGYEPDIEFKNLQLNVKEIQLNGGFKPIWFSKTENPAVAIEVVFHNEGARSFKDTPGILKLTVSTVLSGSKKYSEKEIHELFIDNNIDLSLESDSDDLMIHIYTVSKNFELAINLAEEVFSNAIFDNKKLKIQKQKIIENYNQARFYGDYIADQELSKLIYGEDHPYYEGNIDYVIPKIQKYTQNDIRLCYGKLLVPKDATVTIAGNVDETLIKKCFTNMFNNLSRIKKNNFKEVIQTAEIKNPGKIIHKELDTSQSTIIFALPGILRDSNEKFAYVFVNEFLGGSSVAFNNKLFKEIRDKSGLAYAIGTEISNRDMSSVLFGFAKTAPENVGKLIEKTKEVIKKTAEEGLSNEDLKYYKICKYSRQPMETCKDIVSFLSKCRFNNVKLTEINSYPFNYYKLTVEEVNKVMKKILNVNNMVFVDCGKTVLEAK